jgi:hypothetical protein
LTPTGVAALYCSTGAASGSLLDIRDPAGFVADRISQAGLLLTHEQREDLKAEGLMILCELAGRYEPHRAGYERPGSFAGYAAKYLTLRLQDAWKAMNPTRTRRDEDGRRTTEYLRHTALDDASLTPLAATYGLVDAPQGYATVEAAIEHLPTWDRSCARRMTHMLDEGYGTDAIARHLGLGRVEVDELRCSLASAVAYIRQTEDP